MRRFRCDIIVFREKYITLNNIIIIERIYIAFFSRYINDVYESTILQDNDIVEEMKKVHFGLVTIFIK